MRKTAGNANVHIGVPHSQKIPHCPPVKKLLLRLNKETLIELVFGWFDNVPLCAPDSAREGNDDSDDDEEEDEPVTLESLRQIYEGFRESSSISRKVVVERIIGVDWKSGLSLWQISQLDCRALVDLPPSLRWTAAELALYDSPTTENLTLPRFHATSFIATLNDMIKSLMRCHFYTFSHPQLPLTIIRIQLYNSVGNLGEYPSPKRILYCAFPENAPFIYFTVGVKDNLRDIVIKSLAQTLSRPGQRYKLQSTAFTSKSLSSLHIARGPSRGANCLGAWSLYASNEIDPSPLQNSLPEDKPEPSSSPSSPRDNPRASKRRKIAKGRFGSSAKEGDGYDVDSFFVILDEKFPDEGNEEEEFRPEIELKFEGTHVFAGIRKLVEEGLVDGVRMPSWMTGEDGVSVGRVVDGKMLKRKL